MKLVPILFVIIVALLNRQCEARSMFMCELVHELRGQGFPESLMRDWVCLVEHESARVTHKVGRKNRNGSRDYGLFQINDNFWCSNTTIPGKDCHVTCADVMTDDITKAATCAKKIYKRHKFRAWYGWLDHCDGKQLPDISNC